MMRATATATAPRGAGPPRPDRTATATHTAVALGGNRTMGKLDGKVAVITGASRRDGSHLSWL